MNYLYNLFTVFIRQYIVVANGGVQGKQAFVNEAFLSRYL